MTDASNTALTLGEKTGKYITMFITASVENVDEPSAREEEINPVSAQF